MLIGECTMLSDYELRFPDFKGRPELPAHVDEYWKITEWYVVPGDHVHQGQPFVHIETDDLEFNLSAPVSGLIKSLTSVGTKVKAGDLLAIFNFIEIEEGEGL